jgi:hypothetical protein
LPLELRREVERFAAYSRREFHCDFQQFSTTDKVQKGSYDVIQVILSACRHALELVQAFSGAIQALSAIFVAVLTWFLVRFTRRYVKGTVCWFSLKWRGDVFR